MFDVIIRDSELPVYIIFIWSDSETIQHSKKKEYSHSSGSTTVFINVYWYR